MRIVNVRTQKVSWLTTGTFSQRLFKEALIIFPCTLLLGYYYFFVRTGADFTPTKFVGITLAVTFVISAFNAKKPAPQPATKEPDSILARSNES